MDADVWTMGQNGTYVQGWTCSPVGAATAQQLWWIWDFGMGVGVHLIASAYPPNRYLDADIWTIGDNGTVVQLWDYNGNPNQLWRATADSGYWEHWENRQSFRLLDVDFWCLYQDGCKVQLWDLVPDNQNQLWHRDTT